MVSGTNGHQKRDFRAEIMQNDPVETNFRCTATHFNYFFSKFFHPPRRPHKQVPPNPPPNPNPPVIITKPRVEKMYSVASR